MFHQHNFVPVEIIGKNASCAPINKSYYNITRDGLMFLVMGYTGTNAARMKERVTRGGLPKRCVRFWVFQKAGMP